MVLLNSATKSKRITKGAAEDFTRLLAPFAPHLAEEIWQQFLGKVQSVFLSGWPDIKQLKSSNTAVTIIVQVNGRLRGKFNANPAEEDAVLQQKALALEAVKRFIDDTPVKEDHHDPWKISKYCNLTKNTIGNHSAFS